MRGGINDPQAAKLLAVLFLAGFLTACQPSEGPPISAGSAPTTTQLAIAATKVTETLTSTPTPIPTLSPRDAEAKVIELLGDNAGCELPCLWGITPGLTRYEDAVNFFQSLGWSGSTDFGYYSTGENLQASQLSIRFDIFSVSSVVEKLHMALAGNGFLKHVGIFSIGNTLNSLGAPSEILVYASIDESFLANQTMFDMLLYYEQKGLLVEYVGTATRNDSFYTICPTKPNLLSSQQDAGSGNVSLYLGVNKENPSPGELLRPFSALAYDYRSVGDAFGIDVEEFTERILEGTEYPCFETPIEIWGD